MSKVKLQRLLARRLGLDAPKFVLEQDGDTVVGSVISKSFRGADDFERQTRIRATLREELDPNSLKQVGMIFAFTPEEWDFQAGDRAAKGASPRRPGGRRTSRRERRRAAANG